VATARKPDQLSFEGTSDKNYLAVALDVTDQSSIKNAFSKAVEKFGRIDVCVNNAGYGLGGEFESLSDKQIRQQMEVNFFGLIDVTRAAMEQMRDQKPSGGLIQQVTSIGGQRGVPLFSTYCASKWAVEGFTEAVSQEVKPEWGIKFTCIEPGGFRTKWAGGSMKVSITASPVVPKSNFCSSGTTKTRRTTTSTRRRPWARGTAHRRETQPRAQRPCTTSQLWTNRLSGVSSVPMHTRLSTKNCKSTLIRSRSLRRSVTAPMLINRRFNSYEKISNSTDIVD
jgi:NAD(P)-dependent dehydrogenase (short-subunit alcohol dehydrogenase family)